jgi:vitamin B12 transporter
MPLNFFRAGRILSALLFFLLPLSPLFPQDVSEDDNYAFSDDTGITVTGTAQTSQQMAVIEKADIERRAAADIAALLQDILDINVTRYGAYGNQAGISLRGFDSKRLAFLVDGVPVNSSVDGKFDIEQIDLNSIERIEVIYGGSDSKYNVSGALGGVINIITVKKQKSGLRLGGSLSNTSVMPGEYTDRGGQKQSPHWEDLLDTQNYALSAAYGNDMFSVTANAFANSAANHFIFRDYVQKFRRKDNNEVWDAGGAASLVWELPGLSKLIASSNFYYGDKNIPSSGFSGNAGNQLDFSSRQNFMLDTPRAFRDDLVAETSIAWHFNRRNYISPAGAESRHDQHSITAINRWNWYLGGNLTLRSGVDYRYIFLDSTEIDIRSRHDGGIYLTAEYKPVQRFFVIPSVKAVFTSEGGTPFTAVPKLGFVWNPNDFLTLKNNYFRSFKFPDFEELYWIGGGAAAGSVGNPGLRPEDGWGADLGIALNIKESVKLENVFFAQWTEDSIHWYSKNGGIWRPENSGKAVFFGIDNKLSFTIPFNKGLKVKKIVTSLSYQYLLSYLLSYGYTFASGKHIPYSPEHTLGGSLDIDWETGSLVISGHYESLRYHDTANLTALKPHFLLNAAVNQKFGKNLAAFGVLRNILNESYQSFYDYPMPGITLTVGIKVNYDSMFVKNFFNNIAN